MNESVRSTEVVKPKGNGNLRPPWPKGVSANPGGLPAGTKKVKARLRGALIRKLKANPDRIDEIVDGLIAACAEGDAGCQKIAWDRLDGPIISKSDVNLSLRFEKRVHDDEDYGNDSP